MPPRDHSARIAVERDARRRYQLALAAAVESLRHAERRFDESSAAIDAHIQTALAAAVSLSAAVAAVLDPRPRTACADVVTLASARGIPA